MSTQVDTCDSNQLFSHHFTVSGVDYRADDRQTDGILASIKLTHFARIVCLLPLAQLVLC